MAALPSGPTTTSRPNSSRASFNKNEPGHLTPRDFARSSSLGGHTRAATSGPASTNPNGSLGKVNESMRVVKSPKKLFMFADVSHIILMLCRYFDQMIRILNQKCEKCYFTHKSNEEQR